MKDNIQDRLEYRKAALPDLELLAETRVQVLRAANRLDDTADLSVVAKESLRYYRESFENGSHAAWLVFDGDKFVGAGGISFYQVMPTVDNPTGKKAYVMNMYTDPAYRRKGIALHTLDLLVRESKSRGVRFITLEATEAGRPLYEKYGFTAMRDEMKLKGEA